MRRYSLPILGLVMALILAGCMAQAAKPAPLSKSEAMRPTQAAELKSPEPLPTKPSGPVLAAPSYEPEGGGCFDDALFVGDSIMEGIRQYVAARRQEGELLGTARFLTSTMGVALADLVGERDTGAGFTYRGNEKPLEDIVAEIAPRRVFLLLGLNDLAGANPVVADIVERYARLIANLQAACPGMEVIVITNPPKVASRWLPDYTANRNFGNELIGEFVAALAQMCREREVPYVDAYEALKNEAGALPDDFCRDGYVHLNHRGAAAVVDALNAFAEGR